MEQEVVFKKIDQEADSDHEVNSLKEKQSDAIAKKPRSKKKQKRVIKL